MKPKVLLTREIPATVIEFLRERTELDRNTEDRVWSRDEIIGRIGGKDALLCNITDPIGPEIMDADPDLKVIANFGVGYNNIDVAAATERRIPVTNTPGVLTEATADIAFGLLMAAARRIGEGERLVRSRQWTGWNPMQMLGRDVTGAVLGLIGFGRIGKAMAQRALAFDMKVMYWNRTRLPEAEEKELGVSYLSFEEVVRRADFISLHVAYTKDTHHLVGAKEFAAMKRDAIVVNTARGPVVDEKALVAALQENRIAAAGLDVYEREPELEPELYGLENAVLAPHLGSATTGTRTKMGMMAAENLLAACEGKRPPNCVNPEVYDAC